MKVFVVFVILGLVSQHASGVVVSEGVESVLLPCVVSWSDVTKVVWSLAGSNPSTVHQQQDEDEPYLQNQHYSRRSSVSADALTTGDFSLTLTELRLSDSGCYTCTVYRNEVEMRRITVRLQVTEPPILTSLVVLRFFLRFFLLVVLLALGLLVYIQYYIITVSRVEVKQGVWFVKLPFITKLLLPEDTTVEWSRCAPEPMKVHEYRNGGNYLVRQDKFYCDRTKMEKDPQHTGDLSLSLRNPCFRDSGSYICTVYKDREILTQKVIRLRVKVVREVVEVWELAESVTLPFDTRAQLPEGVTVEWCTYMMVHVFKNGQDQPEEQDHSYRSRTQIKANPLQTGDLSLTLSDITNEDFGVYVCTVRRDEEIIWQGEVLLRVKESGWFGF